MISDVLQLLLLLLLLWGLGFLLLHVVYTGSALFTMPPSIPTDGRTRRRMIRRLREWGLGDMDAPVVYDLGSGFGHLATDVGKAFPRAKVVGIERFFLSYFCARLRLALLPFRRNVRFVRGDLYRMDYRDADAIVMFLLPRHIARFEREILPALSGRRMLILSNSFPVKVPGAKDPPNRARKSATFPVRTAATG
jgi:SAM-dependent methyltransferase